jgi:hypothetical protein
MNVKTLNEQRNDLQLRLQKLESASEETWGDSDEAWGEAHRGLNEAWEDLTDALENAKAYFEKSSESGS